jgi:glycerophosphoryl diester phosphodiesterase
MKRLLQHAAIMTVDGFMAGIPRELPDTALVERCRIIAHRGVHDNRRVLENSLAAFELARASGVWGVECDIRWTADLVPVVLHDPDARRVFGRPLRIAEVTFEQLRRELPLIPSLAEVVAEFGGNTHLMLEIKAEPYPQPARQKAILQAMLSSLAPGADYHFLMLDPALAERVDFVPREFSLLVAEFNLHRLSRECLRQGFGGLMGHYLLLNDTVKRRHEGAGQRVGTGFIHSGNALFRELNRGVEWIFSNEAVRMQNIRDAKLR